MNLTEQLKMIDEYFDNITPEQFNQKINELGIDELIQYIEEEKECSLSLYYSNERTYIFENMMNDNILNKEGTRWQIQLKKGKKVLQTMAHAS